MSQTGYYYISHAGSLLRFSSLEEALAADRQTGYLWIDFHEPQKAELEALIEPLGLHHLSVEDCFDENQIPKVEDYPHNTFILINSFKYDHNSLTIFEIDFFIGPNYLVTVSPDSTGQQQILKDIERISGHDLVYASRGPAYLAHIQLDWVVDDKFVTIESLEEELNECEDVILADHTKFDPSELVRLRREMLSLRKSLFHEREVLMKICRKDYLFVPAEAIIYFRDIYDHLTKFFELTEDSRDLITSLMEMYLSIVNNQMNKYANQTNATVRRLTFITTIFMPLTLLAGIGGMSEYSMMTGPENWRIAYPLFLIGMIVLGAVNYYFLVWFEKRRQKRETTLEIK